MSETTDALERVTRDSARFHALLAEVGRAVFRHRTPVEDMLLGARWPGAFLANEACEDPAA